MKAGAAEFLTKPLDDEIMIQAIRDAVIRSQANLKREGAQRQLQRGAEGPFIGDVAACRQEGHQVRHRINRCHRIERAFV